MLRKTIRITNNTGLHARPAAMFVQTAGKFTSHIWIAKSGKKVNAKSIMGLMSLAAATGNEITIGAVGDDAEVAIKELTELIRSGFRG